MSTPIMNQYNQIKAQNKDYLLFFRLGDFYELFYEDAKIAVEILGITLTRRVQKDEDIPMAGVPAHTCDYYIARLVKAGQKIAICEQMNNIENSSEAGKSNKIIERVVTRIITPGTLTDDILLEEKRNNFLISIFEHNCYISASVFDLSTNEFYVENFETMFLKDFLQKIQPSEILLNQNFIPYFNEYNVWKNAITLASIPEQSQAIAKITKFFNLHSMEAMHHLETVDYISIAMILNYLELTQKYEISKLSTSMISLPKKKLKKDMVAIDKFTLRNLEITKTLQNENYGSLLWLLDQTHTPQGGRALFEIVNNPINNVEKLNARLQKIEFFMSDAMKLTKIRKILKTIPDFERILTKIGMKKALVSDLKMMGIGLINLFELYDLLNVEYNRDLDVLAQKIVAAITSELTKNLEKGYINDGVDKELDAWRQFEKQIDSQIFQMQETYKQETKIATLRIKFVANFGYCIEINSQNKDKLTFQFTLQQDLKNTARYSTPALLQINSKFSQLNDVMIEREKAIFEEFCSQIIGHKSELLKYAKDSAQIDLFTNFAVIALENKYVKPELVEDNSFEIKEGRHPILNKILHEKGEQFVPNDCDMRQCVMFMTGPNMAGKSTYLRQQAIIIFLAHIGMYVPATYAKIGVVDHIFSRIGTNDNLIEGNSTFMMEMIEISLTLNQATSKSFIVFDEVGRGTSAEEGIILAQAILEYLVHDLQARTLFATHYLALQRIEHPNLQKKMMEIHDDPIYFTHKITNGVAKKSYAISIAKLAGMPAKIVNRAHELMNSQ